MKIHIVQKGDTLWKISEIYGVDFVALKNANVHIASPDMVMPGMKIKIPRTEGEAMSEDQASKELKLAPSRDIGGENVTDEKEESRQEQVRLSPRPMPSPIKMPKLTLAGPRESNPAERIYPGPSQERPSLVRGSRQEVGKPEAGPVHQAPQPQAYPVDYQISAHQIHHYETDHRAVPHLQPIYQSGPPLYPIPTAVCPQCGYGQDQMVPSYPVQPYPRPGHPGPGQA